MIVPIEQAMSGLASFVELDTLPLMANGPKKLGAYMAVEALRRNPSVVSKPYEQFFKMLNVIPEDGKTVDLDALSSYLKNAFSKVPSVSLFGFGFDSNDVDKLISRMGGQ